MTVDRRGLALVGGSLVATGLLCLPLGPEPLTAAATALVVAVAGVLVLDRRSPWWARVLGVLLASPLAVVLAAAGAGMLMRVGVPLGVPLARLSLVVAWWLALGALRTLIDRLGSPRLPLRVALAAVVPAALVTGLAASTMLLGPAGNRTAQRLAFLYRAEDNAAWVSHAFALLRLGRQPESALESEYVGYSTLSSLPGVLTDVALRGRPASTAEAVFRAVDATVLGQAVVLAATAGVLVLLLLWGLGAARGRVRPAVPSVLLAGTLAVGIGTALVAASPLLLVGHLSLAVAGLALLSLGLLLVLALRSRDLRAWLLPAVGAWLAAVAAAGSWAFLVATPVLAAGLLGLAVTRSSTDPARAAVPPVAAPDPAPDVAVLDPASSDPVPTDDIPKAVVPKAVVPKADVPMSPAAAVPRGLPAGLAGLVPAGARTAWLLGGVALVAVVAAAPHLRSAADSAGVRALVGAVGSAVQVEPLTLVLGVSVGLAAAVLAVRRSDRMALVGTLLMAAASGTAFAVAQLAALPGAAPTYALTKSLYVVLMVLPVAGLALVARGLVAAGWRVVLVVVLLASALVTTSPALGSLPGWWEAVSDPSPAVSERILAAAAAGADSTRVVCRPSPRLTNLENYFCNRWLGALSVGQGDVAFRNRYLAEGGAGDATWAQAGRDGYLDGALIVDASEIITGEPSPTVVAERTPGVADLAVHGSVDDVVTLPTGVAVVGWSAAVVPGARLRVWARGPVDILSAERTDRPDVAAATGDPALARSGFHLELALPAQRARWVCVVAELPGQEPVRLAGSAVAGCTGP